MKLVQARKRARKTQTEVAEHCRISRRYYQSIEYDRGDPTMKIGLHIAKFLDVNPYYIDEWYERIPVSKVTKHPKREPSVKTSAPPASVTRPDVKEIDVKKQISLKQVRKRFKRTQEEMASLCEISRRHYQNIEYGSSEATIRIGLKIAKVLDVSPYHIKEFYSNIGE
ncbi:helix-turn-helix transcriptional regulator [Cohnella sp. GCM10020058]|uniref:helix-turn-helix transcriptional regulator n=1 Tax=Cohnella sp. GCM10020058 TaxID=3317330 RepID=UPI00362661E4